MSEIRTYYIKAFTSPTGYTGDDLASHLENGPLYTDEAGLAVDVTDEIAALRAENERLRGLIQEKLNEGRYGIDWGERARAALAPAPKEVPGE